MTNWKKISDNTIESDGGEIHIVMTSPVNYGVHQQGLPGYSANATTLKGALHIAGRILEASNYSKKEFFTLECEQLGIELKAK